MPTLKNQFNSDMLHLGLNMYHTLMDYTKLSDAHGLIVEFLKSDEYYLASSSVYGDNGNTSENVLSALSLFAANSIAGGVWLTYHDDEPVAVCIFSFAVSTTLGGVVAKMDDVYVVDGCRSMGIGQKHIDSLKDYLRQQGIKRIDTSVHNDNAGAKRFYEKVGFKSLNEEKLSLLL